MTTVDTRAPIDANTTAYSNAAWSHVHGGRLEMARRSLAHLDGAARAYVVETCARLAALAVVCVDPFGHARLMSERQQTWREPPESTVNECGWCGRHIDPETVLAAAVLQPDHPDLPEGVDGFAVDGVHSGVHS